MMGGLVKGIFITEAAGKPMNALKSIEVAEGSGIVGDRYYLGTGHYSDKPDPGREITLIEYEVLKALKEDFQIDLSMEESRRNIVTEGIELNPLVGQEFLVGDIVLRGLRLCEPCGYLEKLTGKKVLPELVHKGGLRAQILSNGNIQIGDIISKKNITI